MVFMFEDKYYFAGGSDSVSDKVESILASNAEDVDKYQMYRDNQRVHIIPIPCVSDYTKLVY